MRFTRAIVRPPAVTFAGGITSGPGGPDVAFALRQHAAYCDALRRCGVAVTVLDAAPDYPDSTFVEDVAVIAGDHVLVTRPGAPSRLGEAALLRPALARHFATSAQIEPPGTLDGGDVCQADGRFFVGLSHRTDERGAAQFEAWAKDIGFASSTIDIRAQRGVLHLKSAMAYLGDGIVVAIRALADHPALAGYRIVCVDPAEAYAANSVRVNAHVLIPLGFARTEQALKELGLETVAVPMSEFEKMDGGLSCLSLRF